jgi:hypothetical protein
LIERRAPARQPHAHAPAIFDPGREAVLGHGDQHRNVRRDGLFDEIDQAAALCFELAEAIDDDDIGTVPDRGGNRVRDVGDPTGIELNWCPP